MIICGIDPGVTGALSFYDTETGEPVDFADMPLTVGIGGRKVVDGRTLAVILGEKRPGHVFIEKVWSRPTDGVVAAFAFGMSYGIVLGVISALGIPYTEITPEQWRRAALVPAGQGGKSAAKAYASARFTQLWPGKSASVQRVRDAGRIDAALIAHAGALLTGRVSEVMTGALDARHRPTSVLGDAQSPVQGGAGTPPGEPPGQKNGPRG